jgi:hypothetical protein
MMNLPLSADRLQMTNNEYCNLLIINYLSKIKAAIVSIQLLIFTRETDEKSNASNYFIIHRFARKSATYGL